MASWPPSCTRCTSYNLPPAPGVPGSEPQGGDGDLPEAAAARGPRHGRGAHHGRPLLAGAGHPIMTL